MHKYSKDELINAAKRACKRTGGVLSQNDFVRMTGIKEWFIDNLFPKGGWAELSRLANIKTRKERVKKPGDRTLILKKSLMGKSRFLSM